MEHHVPYGVASVIWHPTRVNVLSLSHSWGHRSLPQSIPGSPKVVVDQLRTDACDEFLGIRSRGGEGLQCFAEPMKLETSGRRP